MNKNEKFLRIIVADDDMEDIQLVKESLEENHLPVNVVEVESGEALLKMLRGRNDKSIPQLKPHLIIMDINMPKKNGFETLVELKNDKELCAIPVIIFSTSRSQTDIQKAYRLGANCFISKPITSAEWHNTIGKLGRFWIECASLSQ